MEKTETELGKIGELGNQKMREDVYKSLEL